VTTKKENIHAAISEQQCVEMGRKNGWELKAVKPTKDSILKVNCIFEGEQTSFERSDRND
jgi:hypothetical protein